MSPFYSMATYTTVPIRTAARSCEVAWFDDLCGGDTEFLGVLDESRRSNAAHCSLIAQLADQLGFKNLLLPTSYMVGQEGIPFAAALAGSTHQMNLLLAIRTGEIHPPMLARHIATPTICWRGVLRLISSILIYRVCAKILRSDTNVVPK